MIAMKTVSVAEAKNNLSKLLARVDAGEEISVTRYGKPVARLVAAKPQADSKAHRASVRRVFQQLQELRRGVQLEGDLKAIARKGLD